MRNIVVFLTAANLLGGCGSLSPYVENSVPRPGTARDASGAPVFQSDNSTLVTTYVSVPAAREYGRFLQDAYRQKARTALQLKATYDIGLLSMATTGIGLAAVGTAKEAAAILGLSSGAVSIFGNRYLNVYQRRAYFQGALAIECIIGQTANATTIDAPVLRVQSAINQTRTALSLYAAARNGVLAALQSSPPADVSRIAADTNLIMESAKADIALGNEYLQTASPLGQYTLSKIESIRLLVDQTVAESEPNILQLNTDIRTTLIGTKDLVVTIPDEKLTALSAPTESTAPAGSDAVVSRAFSNLSVAERRLAERQNALINSLNDLAGRKVTIEKDRFQACYLDANSRQLAGFEPPPDPDDGRPREPGDDGDEPARIVKNSVYFVQRHLKAEAEAAGRPKYDPGALDGVMGAKTRTAIINYVVDNFNQVSVSDDLRENLELNSVDDVKNYYADSSNDDIVRYDANIISAIIEDFDISTN